MKIKVLIKKITKNIIGMVILFLCVFKYFPTEAAFYNLSVGARPAGLGGAFTGLADDPNGIDWNPSGICQLIEKEATFMYADLFTGLEDVNIGVNYLACVLPETKIGHIGISWTELYSPQYRETTFSISHARVIIYPYLLGGVTLKTLRHSYRLDEQTINDPVFKDGSSKTAFSGDVGILFFPEDKTYSLGLCLRNITQPDVGLKSKDKVPMELRIGGVYYLKSNLLFLADISKRSDDLNIHLGTEIEVMPDMMNLRGGINLKEMALGTSYTLPLGSYYICFDYAFIYPFEIKETSGTHKIAVKVRW